MGTGAFLRRRIKGAGRYGPVASCPKCYSLLPSGAARCPACGTPILAASPPTVPSVATAPAVPPGAGFIGPGTTRPGPTSVPLFAEEVVISTVRSSPEGQARVVRFNLLIPFAMILVITVPFLVVLLLSGSPIQPGSLVLLFPVVMFGAMFVRAGRRRKTVRPTVAYLTSRRVIVERYRPEASSASMPLDNLGTVEVTSASAASRRAGMSWVYLLPLGTASAMFGRGRGRMAAPGVIWIPAVPTAQAEAFRSQVLAAAQQATARAGLVRPPA